MSSKFRKGSLVVPWLLSLTLSSAALAEQQQQQQRMGKNQTPVAGTTTTVVGITIEEVQTVAEGWSMRKQFLGKQVVNDKNEKVGKVEDLIVAPDKSVTYAIISAGGFLGVGKHDVAIPVKQLKMENGKLILPGATKEAVKAMPQFQYAK